MKIRFPQIALIAAVCCSVTATAASNPTGTNVSRTFARMARSTPQSPETVRVLFYGQSIVAQDWGRKFVVPELKRRYPSVRFVVDNRAIPGYEAPKLIRTAESDLYPFYPDLLFFHVYGDTSKYVEIVRRVRERTTADVILWTSHLNATEGASRKRIEKLLEHPDERSRVIRETAEKYRCMFIDLRAKWCRMLLEAGAVSQQYLKDGIHLKDSSLPIYGQMICGDLPFDCVREEPNPLAGTVRTVPAGTKIPFVGNRVVAIADGEAGAVSDVYLDGKPVARDPGVWTFSRMSPGIPHCIWPLVNCVTRRTPPAESETWTLELLDGFNADGSVLPFKVSGSKTGFDGCGWNTNLFVSASGKVVIQPEDWPSFKGRWGRWTYTRQKPQAGLKAHWSDEPLFTDPYVPTNRLEEITLVQGCANGAHVLELKPRTGSPLGILQFRIYAPGGGQ